MSILKSLNQNRMEIYMKGGETNNCVKFARFPNSDGISSLMLLMWSLLQCDVKTILINQRVAIHTIQTRQ